jgi:hypothetical protein
MPSTEVSITLTMNSREASAVILLLGKCTGQGTGETTALYEVLTQQMRGELEHRSELIVNTSGAMYVKVGEREED